MLKILSLTISGLCLIQYKASSKEWWQQSLLLKIWIDQKDKLLPPIIRFISYQLYVYCQAQPQSQLQFCLKWFQSQQISINVKSKVGLLNKWDQILCLDHSLMGIWPQLPHFSPITTLTTENSGVAQLSPSLFYKLNCKQSWWGTGNCGITHKVRVERTNVQTM